MTEHDWVENENERRVIADENGEVQAVWHEHYELNRETGEMEPAEPPEQEGEARRETVLAEKLPDRMPEDAPVKLEDLL